MGLIFLAVVVILINYFAFVRSFYAYLSGDISFEIKVCTITFFLNTLLGVLVVAGVGNG
jgi:hypothetical protein